MKTTFALITAAFLLITATGCQEILINRDVLYQNSNITALGAGVYDGETTIEQLQMNGDFGLGTFNGLDGELIAINGAYYQIKSDATAVPLGEDDLNLLVPYAAVTFFETDRSLSVRGVADYEQLKQHIENFITNPNTLYAIKIDGIFRYVQTRSVPAQHRPYRPLPDVLSQEQVITDFRSQPGTLVGYRLPEYINGVGIPGYHLHFISADRRSGGHVLALELEGVNVELDQTDEFHMTLPQTPMFATIDLDPAANVRLMEVE